MIVFSSYFKIIKQYKKVIMLYTVMALAFAVLTTLNSQETLNFTDVKPKVAIINNDENTELIQSFTNYISEKTQIVNVENEENEINDALFFREVSYILIIPKDYTNLILNNKEVKIETLKTPDSSATFTEMLLNRYIKMVDIYSRAGMSEKEITEKIDEDLKNEINIVLDSKVSSLKTGQANYFYNFANYTFLAICIYVISVTLLSFNDEKIKKRNKVGKISMNKISRELFFGNLILILCIWIIYVLISIILYKEIMLSKTGILLIINSLVFCTTAATIGFLVGNIVKSKEASSGIVNVVALGTSFLCGAFVPQQYLGESVLNLSKILPSYWYILNNDNIVKLTQYNKDTLIPIIINMLILGAFVVVFFVVTNIINKLNERSN